MLVLLTPNSESHNHTSVKFKFYLTRQMQKSASRPSVFSRTVNGIPHSQKALLKAAHSSDTSGVNRVHESAR